MTDLGPTRAHPTFLSEFSGQTTKRLKRRPTTDPVPSDPSTSPDPPPPPPPPPTPPATVDVTAVAPLAGATGRAITVNAKATCDTDLDPLTVTGTTVHLRDHLGNNVAGVVTWDAVNRQIVFDPLADLANNETYTCTITGGVGGVRAANGDILVGNSGADYVWSFTTIAAPGTTFSLTGWAAVAPVSGPRVGQVVTGGEGGALFEPTTFAEFRESMIATGTRIVRPTATVNFFGATNGSDSFKVDNGNVTLDGSNWHGSLGRHIINWRCSNVLITQMRIRIGDSFTAAQDQDGIGINPGNDPGDWLQGYCIDHCSVLFSYDMCIAILNKSEHITVQHSIIGCGLRQSSKPDNPKGLGANVTVPGNNIADEATEHGKKISFIRCYYVHNFQRNWKAERAELVEWLNCVQYNPGNQAAHGNARSANYIGCLLRKGNDTSLPGGGNNSVYEFDNDPAGGYANSVYFPLTGGINLFENKNRTSFTPTGDHIGTSAERSTPNTGSGYTPATITDALADTIVAAAGPTAVDSIDQALKDDWTNGTGVFYNGAGFPAPNASWPAPF